MSDLTDMGISGRMNWLVGGAIGGVVGSFLFGVVMWAVDPALVTETIPALYGLEPGAIGWGFHLGHGLVLGIIFGFLVSRRAVLGSLTAEVETDVIAGTSLSTRFAFAGLVYGLAIWAVLPVVIQPLWVGLTGIGEPGFPVAAFESLVGHLVYGLLLGALFSLFVDASLEAEESDAPFDEAAES